MSPENIIPLLESIAGSITTEKREKNPMFLLVPCYQTELQ